MKTDSRNTIMISYIHWGDYVIITFILAISFFTFPAFKTFSCDTVTVFRDNKIIAEYPLNEKRTFSVDGANGNMEIEIVNNSVHVRHSSCPHQICVKEGYISRAPGQIVCAPNHILISLKNSHKEEKLDAVVR
jgi:hypothetical protein